MRRTDFVSDLVQEIERYFDEQPPVELALPLVRERGFSYESLAKPQVTTGFDVASLWDDEEYEES